MKQILLFGAFALSTASFAADYKCYDPSRRDASFVATFKNLRSDKPTLTLEIPLSETQVTKKSGECHQDRGSVALSFTCLVKQTATLGFVVKINEFEDDFNVQASIYPWSLTGAPWTLIDSFLCNEI